MKWKLPLFAAITLLLFFGAAEGSLWIAGVAPLAAERDPFQGFAEGVKIFELDAARGVWRTNRRAIQHSFNYQEFREPKPAGGFRLFVIGGSSAWGFPWGADVAFARPLGAALAAARPGRTIESINAAAMSYGSHRLRIVAREVLAHAPDVLVVSTGHNEFVEQRFYRDLVGRSGALARAQGVLYHLRSYSALARTYERVALRATPRPGEEGAAPRATAELLGLDVSREYATGVGDVEREQARRRFEENMSAILDDAARRDVRVVLCTEPSNLRDWVPNESIFAPSVGAPERQELARLVAAGRAALAAGDGAAAVAALERARAIDGGHAEAHYRLGQAYEAVGRADEARAEYVLARDLDARPARAPSGINETMRRLARERGVLLVDVERAFEAATPHGLVGFNLIEDYVHPKPAAHRLAAREIWRAMLEAGLLGEPRTADPALFERAAGPAPVDSGATGLPAAAAGAARTPALLFNLAVVLENQGLAEQAMEKYRECLALDPRYVTARHNLGRLLARQGRFDEAIAIHRETLTFAPEHLSSLLGLGEALRQRDRLEEARGVFARATAADPRAAQGWNRLGVTLTQLGRLDEAAPALARAVELAPRDAGARVDFGFNLLGRGRIDEAEREFAAALALRAEDVRARNGLGAVRAEQGRFDEAERLFRESLALDPRDAYARGALELLERRRAGGR